MRLDDLHEGDVFTYTDFMKRKAAAAMPDRRTEQEKYDDAFFKQTKSFSPEQDDDVDFQSQFDNIFNDSVSATEWTATMDGATGIKQIKDDEGSLAASIDMKTFKPEGYNDYDVIYITNLFVFGKDRHARKLINDLILEFPHKRIFISQVKSDKQAKFLRSSYHISDEGELNVMESITEGAKMAWARKGKTIVRKYRCTSGRRKGRIVSKPSQCTAAIDLKKRASFKRTKARLGSKMARKAKKTKRINPASRRLKNLNKRR